jgi:hypothetical protein
MATLSEESVPVQLQDGTEGRLHYTDKGHRYATNWFFFLTDRLTIWFDVRKILAARGMPLPVGIQNVTHEMSIVALGEEILPFMTLAELQSTTKLVQPRP